MASCQTGADEKSPLTHRLPAPLLRHLLASHRSGQRDARAAAAELGRARTRFSDLYSAGLRACAQGHADSWSPGCSGGNHHPDWPPEVAALLTKLLSSKPPSSSSAVARARPRRRHFQTDRASVRRWALEPHLAPDTRYKKPPPPVRRGPARALGALWQSDATPHRFLPNSTAKQVLLDLLDDATRRNTGARLYDHDDHETLLAHLDFLPRAFTAHGLPLALDVASHSFFFTHPPDAFTQRGAALHFYGVALRSAPTPQAKGKIERRHDYWQKRLPPLLAADQILERAGANRLLDQLLPHVNPPEVHRELGTTPAAVHAPALAEKRSVLRPGPACPRWPHVWSQPTRVRVGDDGQVPGGLQRHRMDAAPRTTVVRCLRPDGDIFYLRHGPVPEAKPIVLLHCPVF